MSKNYGARIPLHLQTPEVAKAVKDNPSWESFQPNIVHGVQYREDFADTRTTIHDQARVRRYPNAQLDVRWTAQQVVDAIHKMEYNGNTGDPNFGSAALLPLEVALLTIVLPASYRMMEPQQAEIMTQLSPTEKEQVRELVIAHLKAEEQWNAGFGGGAVPGRQRQNVGG